MDLATSRSARRLQATRPASVAFYCRPYKVSPSPPWLCAGLPAWHNPIPIPPLGIREGGVQLSFGGSEQITTHTHGFVQL